MSPATAAPQPIPQPLRLGPVAAYRCRRRIHLEHDPTVNWDDRIPPDPAMALRQHRNRTHRTQVKSTISAQITLTDNVTWYVDNPPAGDMPPALWQPKLRSATRSARPDLLLHTPDGGYVPVLIRGHRTTDPGKGATISSLTQPLAWDTSYEKKLRSHHDDALALAHTYQLLDELGIASPTARGGIIGLGVRAEVPDWDDGAVIAWHAMTAELLAEYDERFTDRLAVARAAARGADPLAQPSKIAECRRCPWWSICGPQMQKAHDVSLLASGSDAPVLREAGLLTFDDVAVADPQVFAELPISGVPLAELQTRARAMVAQVPMVRRDGQGPIRRADIELDVDMESFSDDGAYLWGTLLSGPGMAQLAEAAGSELVITSDYVPFVTWEPLDTDATGHNFIAFWRYLTGLRQACAAHGLTFAAYCYSRRAEERWLYGTPARHPYLAQMPRRAEIADFCESDQWVDVFADIKRAFVVPGSLRLKTVARLAGFSWRDSEPGGENSMAWYRIATGQAVMDAAAVPSSAVYAYDVSLPATGPAPLPTPDDIVANRQRILDYNEDDVRATLALRNWLTGPAWQLPTASELTTRFQQTSQTPGG